MDESAADAMQRLALAGLVESFFHICQVNSVWDPRSLMPAGLKGEGAEWTGERHNNDLVLGVSLEESDLGFLRIVACDSRLAGWVWSSDLPSPDSQNYIRTREGAAAEARLGSLPGIVPTDLFERVWNALHTAMRRYIYGNKLRPSGMELHLFPPL